jgi:hypothetical protein
LGEYKRKAKRIARGGKVLTDLYPGDKIIYGDEVYVANSENYWSHTSIVSINNGIVKFNNGQKLGPETRIQSKKFKYGQKLKELKLHDGGDPGKVSDFHLKIQKAKDDIEAECASKIGEILGGDSNDDQPQLGASPRRSKRIKEILGGDSNDDQPKSGASPRRSKRIGIGVNPPKRLVEGGDDTTDRRKRKHDSTV